MAHDCNSPQPAPHAVPAAADGGPRLVVLDELPYLTAAAPELPFALQLLLDEGRAAGGPPLRLVICGSAVSVMSGLLSGTAPLRGRVLRTRRAALLRVPRGLAILGRRSRPAARVPAERRARRHPGVPGPREPPPGRVEDFDAWLVEHVLEPSSALFHEDEWLLDEEPRLTDRALYMSRPGCDRPWRLHGERGAPSAATASPSSIP